MKVILLDIEGTTTPIDFVHRKLFPFAKERIEGYDREHLAELAEEITHLVEESTRDSSYALAVDAADADSISAYLKHLIDVDRKCTPLKSIQGKIWKEGYEAGLLVSEVYDDVPEAFAKWKAVGKTIAIYSSGSVLAQQLLFRYTDHGDLTPYISSYFDTNIGAKRESESYRNIAAELNCEPSAITFVSDIAAELDAALDGGLEGFLCARDRSIISQTARHSLIHTFEEIS